MDLSPYRKPAPRVEDLEPVVSPGAKLGELRSRHLAWPKGKLVAGLIGGVFLFLLILRQLVSGDAQVGVHAVLGIVILSAAWFALDWLISIDRGDVDLHQGGVVKTRWSKRTEVLFEDVDQLWVSAAGNRVKQVRLICHDQRELIIPGHLHRMEELKNALYQACSLNLLRDADAALDRGETLDFKRVSLTSRSLRTAKEELLWSEVVKPRLTGMRLDLLTDQRRVRIDLERVPHPALLVRLIVKLVEQSRSPFDGRPRR